MWSTQWLFVILGLLMVVSNNAQVCSNNVPGVQTSDVCCVAECVTCGGSGCGSRARDVDLTGADCCVGRIRDAGVYCDVTKAAPCIIGSDSTCISNGLSGLENDGVCCVAECPQCGGSGCGSAAQSVGLSANDCCRGRIISSGVFCDDSGMAPCIIGDEGACGPALTITLEWSETDSDLDLYVTEPGGPVVSFANMVGDVGFLDMDVRSGPGIETYTIFRFLDPASLPVNGAYKFQANLFSGSIDTTWTLTAKLIEDEVIFETGDFQLSTFTEFFTVSVTDYDSSCEDGTDAFALGSRDSTSSPEDKLP